SRGTPGGMVTRSAREAGVRASRRRPSAPSSAPSSTRSPAPAASAARAAPASGTSTGQGASEPGRRQSSTASSSRAGAAGGEGDGRRGGGGWGSGGGRGGPGRAPPPGPPPRWPLRRRRDPWPRGAGRPGRGGEGGWASRGLGEGVERGVGRAHGGAEAGGEEAVVVGLRGVDREALAERIAGLGGELGQAAKVGPGRLGIDEVRGEGGDAAPVVDPGEKERPVVGREVGRRLDVHLGPEGEPRDRAPGHEL